MFFASVVVTRDELRLFYFQQTLQCSFFFIRMFFFFIQLIKTISTGFFSYPGTDQYSNIFQFNFFVFGKLFESEIPKKYSRLL